MRNQKYYYLQGDHIRSTVWLAESALAQRINIKRIFVRKEERV